MIGAFYIRFDGVLSEQYLPILIAQIPVQMFFTIGMLKMFHLYRRLWQYAGSGELLSVTGANIMAAILMYGYVTLTGSTIPKGIYIVNTLILITLTGGSRIAIRVYKYLINRMTNPNELDRTSDNNVLVVGAGDAALLVTREIERFHSGNRRIIGFVDDDKSKYGKTILKARVLGNRSDILAITKEHHVQEIIIAMPSVKGREIREIVNICRQAGCKLTILPGVYEIIEGNVSVSQLRPVAIEDLLGRDPVKLDTTAVQAYIKDKSVLVTGAGGSIGSEICRQVAKLHPHKIILLGKGENSIYEINNELNLLYPDIDKVPVIADVRDRERIQGIMDQFKPQVVFHAAAHKHVPLMEYQPMEAIRNNVWGTKVVSEEAAAHNVETFVMISTDKAVNPTSVMGCTKRVAEMFVQSMNGEAKTRFVVVRFGNVLGSRGSVIPLFKKQIARGGPLTVTDPEMKRYFMTIPEASQLVLQAGSMAKGGEVFVLDMGDPVKIVDLAKDLITLSGLKVDKDIEIKFTGLRPGEKLFEELLSAEDGTDVTNHEKIFTARIKHINKSDMDNYIQKLLEKVKANDVVKTLQEVVPTYTPNRKKS